VIFIIFDKAQNLITDTVIVTVEALPSITTTTTTKATIGFTVDPFTLEIIAVGSIFGIIVIVRFMKLRKA
jgi:hypothetical protein